MLHKMLLTSGVLMITALFLSVFSMNSDTLAAKSTPPVVEIVEMPANLTTQVWGIFNPKSGDIIVGEHVQDVHPIASVVKLFTAYVVMESTHKHDPFTITYADVKTEGRSGSLSAGADTTPYKLLFPLLLESSNDAAVAIERSLMAEYRETISAHHKVLGISQTHIEDSSGLNSKTEANVAELAIFFTDLKKRYPHILDITQLQTYVTDEEDYVNNNPGRTFESFTGGKHGYTDEANHTFVGTFKTKKGEIGIVLLESEDLERDIQSLVTYADTHLP